MYRNALQRGLLTILHSGGSNPLSAWDVCTRDGWISNFLDQDIKSMVLEIGGNNVSTSYITCPKGKMVLGIVMPFLVMVVKNLKKYFSFEVTIMDDAGFRRRFRASNFQSNTQIMPLCTAMPIGLSEGWNQIQFNLAEFTRRAYNRQYIETQHVKINANIRIRRIYFADRIYPEDELPTEYKLFFPIPTKKKGPKRYEKLAPAAPFVEEKRKSLVKGSSRTSVRTSGAAPVVPVETAVETEVVQQVPDAPAGGEETADTKIPTITEVADTVALEELAAPDRESIKQVTQVTKEASGEGTGEAKEHGTDNPEIEETGTEKPGAEAPDDTMTVKASSAEAAAPPVEAS